MEHPTHKQHSIRLAKLLRCLRMRRDAQRTAMGDEAHAIQIPAEWFVATLYPFNEASVRAFATRLLQYDRRLLQQFATVNINFLTRDPAVRTTHIRACRWLKDGLRERPWPPKLTRR